jgi:hypothetical protein
MRSYENTIQTVADTLINVRFGGPFGFYLSNEQIAYIYGKEPQVVEMDMQMTKELVEARLINSFI